MRNNFKILIVDDDEHLLLIYKKLLLTAGYQVITVQNGTEAIEMAKKHRPQLVLLDVILPDISGIDVLKTIKKQPETQHCFVVLISSKLISSEDRSLGLETGADDYLLKPIQNRELVARVDSFMRHKKTIDKLIKSEEHFRVTLDSIGDAVIATDTEGFITRMNPVAESLTGWQLSDIKGKPLKEAFRIVNAFSGEEVENPVNKVLKTGGLVGLANHTKLISKNGKEFQISDSAAPIKNDDGKVIGVVLVFRDVTEEYHVRQQLKENEERFRVIVESAPDPIFIQSDMKFAFLNPAACHFFGIKSANELLGKPVMGSFHPDYHEKIRQRIHDLNEKRKPVHQLLQQKFIRMDGSEVWGETAGEPILYEGRSGALIFIRDITQRIKADQNLQESETRFRLLAESAPFGIVIADQQQNTLFSNNRFTEISGYTIDDIPSVEDWWPLAYPDEKQRKTIRENWNSVIEKAQKEQSEIPPLEYMVRCKNGEFKYIEFRSSSFKDLNFVIFTDISARKKAEVELKKTIEELQKARKASLNLIDDLTEEIEKRKQYEKELKESESRFSIAFNASPAPLVISEIDTGNFINVNNRWVEMLGYSKEELIGKTSKEVGIWRNPSERDRIIQLLLENDSFKEKYIEFNTKTGDTILALWSGETILLGGKKLMLSMIHDITERIKAERELRILKENLEAEVEEKTQELRERIAELERFQEATIEREFRIKELRDEIERLKEANS